MHSTARSTLRKRLTELGPVTTSTQSHAEKRPYEIDAQKQKRMKRRMGWKERKPCCHGTTRPRKRCCSTVNVATRGMSTAVMASGTMPRSSRRAPKPPGRHAPGTKSASKSKSIQLKMRIQS